MRGPCEWPLAIPDETEGCLPCDTLYELNDTQQELVKDMAVELLWNWTGHRFGLCETTVRPCRSSCSGIHWNDWGSHTTGAKPQIGGWTPALIGGEWMNLYCGDCTGSACNCGDQHSISIRLPGPVARIDEVIVGGEALPISAWILRSGTLYRVDGGVWPDCNSETGDPLDPDSGAWEITYRRGYPVPAGGQLAAYRLACELAKALNGDNDCQLPERVQSITREGVSMAVLDGFEGLEDGRTGIWHIDAWISAVNAPQTRPSKVYSPDLRPQRGTAQAAVRGRR